MTCSVCGAEPCINPSFCRTCRKADVKLAADRRVGRLRESTEILRARRLLASDISLERAWHELSHIKGRAAYRTVEALMLGLRRGVSALKEPDVRRRLSELSENQLAEVGNRLQRFEPTIARAWSADEVKVLIQTHGSLR
jgi:hypothetical protein